MKATQMVTPHDRLPLGMDMPCGGNDGNSVSKATHNVAPHEQLQPTSGMPNGGTKSKAARGPYDP